MGLFVKLDANWPDDESVIEVGLDGAGLHAFIMCIAKRTETDGWVGRRILTRYGATDELIDRLATCAPTPLVEVRDDGAVRSAGWLKANPSQAALEANRASKAEAGRKGNHTKHKHPGEYEACPLCHKDGQVVARSDRTGSQGARGSDRKPSPETESETETASDRTSSHDPSHTGFAGPKPIANLAEIRDRLGAPAPDGERGTA